MQDLQFNVTEELGIVRDWCLERMCGAAYKRRERVWNECSDYQINDVTEMVLQTSDTIRNTHREQTATWIQVWYRQHYK